MKIFQNTKGIPQLFWKGFFKKNYHMIPFIGFEIEESSSTVFSEENRIPLGK